MKEKFQIAVPKSYEHLQKMSLKGQKLTCDQQRSHTSSWFHVVVAIKLVAATASFIFLVLSLFSKWRGLSLGLTAGLLGIIAYGSALYHVRLYRRSWMQAHSEKVFTDLIPKYLRTQIGYTCTALVGDGSRLELVQQEMLKVIIKGQDMQNFVKQLRATKGKDGDLPPYLAKMQKESEDCLRFNEAHDLLMKSEKVLKVDFIAKLEEVAMFNQSLSASMQEKKNLVFAQEVCLEQVRAWCQSLNMLSDKFNQFFDESCMSKISSDIAFSQDMEKTADGAKLRADYLLQKLTDLYGVKLEEKKAGEPAKYGETLLTEEDWKELEELDLGSLGKAK